VLPTARIGHCWPSPNTLSALVTNEPWLSVRRGNHRHHHHHRHHLSRASESPNVLIVSAITSLCKLKNDLVPIVACEPRFPTNQFEFET